jgi:hypothetical protein
MMECTYETSVRSSNKDDETPKFQWLLSVSTLVRMHEKYEM